MSERISALAPFVTWDADPYLVIREDGGLSYVVDGYTTSTHFPNANAAEGAESTTYVTA